MKSQLIFLPTFGGFYDSIWYDSDQVSEEINQYLKDNNLEKYEWQYLNNWGIDEQYFKDIALAYCKEYQDWINKTLGLEIELEYESIWKPKFYNFQTDKIYARIKWKDDYKLANFLIILMGKHKEKLTKLIHDNHTSYDGFISFMDNKFEDWIRNIKNIAFDYQENEDNLYLTYLISYLLLCESNCENYHQFDELIFEEISYQISMGSYLEQQSEEAKDELKKHNDIIEYNLMLKRNQLQIHFL